MTFMHPCPGCHTPLPPSAPLCPACWESAGRQAPADPWATRPGDIYMMLAPLVFTVLGMILGGLLVWVRMSG